MLRRSLILAACLLLSTFLTAQCAQDHRDNKNGGVLIKDFTISGTQALSSTELDRITGSLIGSCFNDDSEELTERIRALFQDRGYFAAEYKSVRLKPLDPLGDPKPVLIEAEIAEGVRYKLGTITFLQNHALSSEKLRDAFPLKTGDLFERDKVAGGLGKLRKLYGAEGYLDLTGIPETEFASNGTASLKITVDEGPQYHMGKLDILAGRELAFRLRSKWKLDEGAVYDLSYMDRFAKENRDLLPSDSDLDVERIVDCPERLVDLKLVIARQTEDDNAVRLDQKYIPCEPSDKDKQK